MLPNTLMRGLDIWSKFSVGRPELLSMENGHQINMANGITFIEI